MEYYTEKNGLAQYWNRDHFRMEVAKWVYHHPETVEKLIEYLLSAREGSPDLTEILSRLDQNDALDVTQQMEIDNLQDNSPEPINIQMLEELINSLEQGGN